jgi:hypothetical protein
MRTNTLFLVTVIVVLLDMMLSSCLLYRVRASGKVAHALDIASVQYHKNCLRDFFVSLGPLVLAIELMITCHV